MPDNYRPISQLSSFSKILEKVSSQQLTEHLDMENIISDNQFGFRKGHSTLHPLIVTRNELESAKNRNEFSILITLDLKKAFDTVESDQILPEKLKHYGCDSNSKNWFSSFFKSRKQYVS
jgi:retron-type reverse transcriptase